MPTDSVVRMRIDLSSPPPPSAWPDGVTVGALLPEEAEAAHRLLVLGYAQGGGEAAPFPVWWPGLAADAEFDPALCLLARGPDGEPVGLAQAWTSAFVKDLVVHPRWRRRGVGRALLLHLFALFHARGAPAVELKVHADNEKARRLYESVGMRVV